MISNILSILWKFYTMKFDICVVLIEKKIIWKPKINVVVQWVF